MDIAAELNKPDLCLALRDRLERDLAVLGRPVRFMEVCGTHTVAIFQSGLRSLLPQNLVHISGPGCPVCVTHDAEVAAFLELAAKDGIMLATFGDLMRVPGPDGRTLKHAQADGARVEVVYSPLDAVRLAEKHRDRIVVFLGVGFETTAPTVAGAILLAARQNLTNFCVFSCHKLVPPALQALLDADDQKEQPNLDAFLLPGHVAVVIGLEPFFFIHAKHGRPAAVAGFEPADILAALLQIVRQLLAGKPETVNAYPRAVNSRGSSSAVRIMEQVFQVGDANWRGLGMIPASGLALRQEFGRFDAVARLGVTLREIKPIPGCKCGDVLTGALISPQCPLFGKVCTPQNPVGPCMVSTEGSCAAWYKYNL